MVGFVLDIKYSRVHKHISGHVFAVIVGNFESTLNKCSIFLIREEYFLEVFS